MKKTIIVYYSMSGNVKQTAERLAAETGAELLALHPVKAYPDKGAKKYLWGGKSALMGEKPKLYPYSFNADRYDTVIFGAPVWAGRVCVLHGQRRQKGVEEAEEGTGNRGACR